MSQKKLPDHRQSFDDPVVEFSAAQIDQLCTKYEFPKSYPLEEKLNNVALFHEQKNYYKSPPPLLEQRALFNTIQESALNMEKAIKGLGRSELLLIGRQNLKWNSYTKIDQISEIRHVAERALKDLSEQSSPGGRPKRTLERTLVFKLAQIYHEGTGRTDHYGHNQYIGKKFTGRLVEFIEDIVKNLDAPLSNYFIGTTLKELFKAKP